MVGGRWRATHSRQTVNMIDGFLIVGRRTGLDKAGVTNYLALPRTEGFPGTQDLHIRISWSPFNNRRWEKLRHLA